MGTRIALFRAVYSIRMDFLYSSSRCMKSLENHWKKYSSLDVGVVGVYRVFQ